MNLKDAFTTVLDGTDLDQNDAESAMLDLMGGQAAPELISGFLVALRGKGETSSELAGFAAAMRAKAHRIHPEVKGRLIDTCGTGGAPVKAFNVSTTSAFVAAAAGAPVAKHGNRSTTRPSGSADVLEALGVNLELPPDDVSDVISQTGIGFLFAPAFHPAMRYAIGPRKALGVRTVFNLLGPLTNPADAKGHVLGVFDPAYLSPMAEALDRLGVERALVDHGDWLDEANPAGATRFVELVDGSLREGSLTPQDVGLDVVRVADIGPMEPAASAKEVRRILGGGSGPRAEFTAFNAGLALTVAGLAKDPAAGVAKARDVLASGQALEKLDAFVAATNRGRAA
jgi:anthranilate phosphoribosyltransferase